MVLDLGFTHEGYGSSDHSLAATTLFILASGSLSMWFVMPKSNCFLCFKWKEVVGPRVSWRNLVSDPFSPLVVLMGDTTSKKPVAVSVFVQVV